MAPEINEMQITDLVLKGIDGDSKSVNEVLNHIGPNSLMDIPRIDELVQILESISDPRSHVLSAVLAFEREDDEGFEREISLGVEAKEIYANVLLAYIGPDTISKYEFLRSVSKDLCPLAKTLYELSAQELKSAVWDSIKPTNRFVVSGQDLSSLAFRHEREIYLGGASCSFFGVNASQWFKLETGFDCTAEVASIYIQDDSKTPIGLAVIPYGPWSASEDAASSLAFIDVLNYCELLPAPLIMDNQSTAITPSWGFIHDDAGQFDGTGLGSIEMTAPLRISTFNVDCLQDLDEPAIMELPLSGRLIAFSLVPNDKPLVEEFDHVVDGWNEFPFILLREDVAQSLGILPLINPPGQSGNLDSKNSIQEPQELLSLMWEGVDVRELSVKFGNELEFNLGSYSSESVAIFDIGSMAGSLEAKYWSVVARLERILEWLDAMDRGLSSICQRDLRLMQRQIHAVRSLNNSEPAFDNGLLDQLANRIRALQIDCSEEELTILLRSSDEYVIDSLLKSRRLSESQVANLRTDVEELFEDSDLFDDLTETLENYEVEEDASEVATPYSPVITESLYRAQQLTATEESLLYSVAVNEFHVWESFEEGWQSLYWHPNATEEVRSTIIQKVFGPYEPTADQGHSASVNLEIEYFAGLDPRIGEGDARRLALHPSRLIRLALAANPSIPTDVRESLKADSDTFVRLRALQDWSWINQVWPGK